jgi:hypothetical protein
LLPTARAQVETALRETESAVSELQSLTEVTRSDIEEIARQYAGEKSSFLAGVAGGIAGATGGVALGGALGGIVVVTGPAGLALGAALAILAWRGRGHWKLERATERARIGLDTIRGELATLPENTPPEIREELWRGYRDIFEGYREVAVKVVREAGDVSDQLTSSSSAEEDIDVDAPLVQGRETPPGGSEARTPGSVKLTVTNARDFERVAILLDGVSVKELVGVTDGVLDSVPRGPREIIAVGQKAGSPDRRDSKVVEVEPNTMTSTELTLPGP